MALPWRREMCDAQRKGSKPGEGTCGTLLPSSALL
jgi:hypothetical protein